MDDVCGRGAPRRRVDYGLLRTFLQTCRSSLRSRQSKEVLRMSICPKNKNSRSHRDKRRANWKMSAPTLVKCSKCGALMMPHRVCKNCGTYNKKEVIKVED
ncbi:MAG: 50S ribosomal protein L32 [Lachnospiraceae bacterium]